MAVSRAAPGVEFNEDASEVLLSEQVAALKLVLITSSFLISLKC